MTFSKQILGAHMSIADGFVEAARKTVEVYRANALQFFLKSPRGRGVTKLTREEADKFRDYSESVGGIFAVAHCSYLLNFAKPMGLDRWALDSLVADLKSMASLGGIGVVLHVGKSLELPYDEAEKHLISNLKTILDETAVLDVEVILENTAGQGTEMGTTIEQLQSFYEKLGRHPRVTFCLDTCHLFAAGYNLRSEADVKKVLDAFDRAIGLKRIRLFHFNDSLKELGSRVDRHQNLGEGSVGTDGLKALARFASAHGIPMILETPEKMRTHLDDLKILKQLLS